MTQFLEATVDKFIFKVAADRWYTPEGIWASIEPDGRVRVGLSDYQQQLNGDVAFVHFRPLDTVVPAGGEFADIETIKATLDCLSPVAGTLVEFNGALESKPELVNQEPYGAGWLAVLEVSNWEADRARLLTAEAYLAASRDQALKELGS